MSLQELCQVGNWIYYREKSGERRRSRIDGITGSLLHMENGDKVKTKMVLGKAPCLGEYEYRVLLWTGESPGEGNSVKVRVFAQDKRQAAQKALQAAQKVLSSVVWKVGGIRVMKDPWKAAQ